jgi:hypothetical protein
MLASLYLAVLFILVTGCKVRLYVIRSGSQRISKKRELRIKTILVQMLNLLA